jgi:hypothetical protein
VLGTALELFTRYLLQNLGFAGRLKAQADCLRSGGLVP